MVTFLVTILFKFLRVYINSVHQMVTFLVT